ncbi:MAG: RNA methyltransferase [Mucinivorans sp.]
MVSEVVRSSLVIEELFRVNENCTWIEMNRISQLKTPTRELAVVRLPDWSGRELEGHSSPLMLALDGVQDPGNLGSIIRTADWFGISTIYCSLSTADCYAPKVVQATMGSVCRVKVVYTDLVSEFAGRGIPILGTFLERSTNIYSMNLGGSGSSVLVMGSEGHGISPEVEFMVSERIHIPRFGAGESLNVASATAIAVALLSRC